MLEHIGVLHPLVSMPTHRDLLMFDRLAVVKLEDALRDLPPEKTRTLAYLAELGIAFQPTLQPTQTDKEHDDVVASAGPALITNALIAETLRAVIATPHAVESLVSRAAIRRQLAGMPPPPPYTDVEQCVHRALRTVRSLLAENKTADELRLHVTGAYQSGNVHILRMVAQNLRLANRMPVAPLLPRYFEAFASSGREGTVLNVVFDQLPQPSDSADVDDVLRFRSDEEARRSFRRLHGWMVDAARGTKTANELAAELQLLVDKYTEYMRLHKMKSETGALEAFFTTAADIVGNVAKLDLGSAVRTLFTMRQKKIALLEAEMSAPGREVAYIVAAKQKFGGGA